MNYEQEVTQLTADLSKVSDATARLITIRLNEIRELTTPKTTIIATSPDNSVYIPAGSKQSDSTPDILTAITDFSHLGEKRISNHQLESAITLYNAYFRKYKFFAKEFTVLSDTAQKHSLRVSIAETLEEIKEHASTILGFMQTELKNVEDRYYKYLIKESAIAYGSAKINIKLETEDNRRKAATLKEAIAAMTSQLTALTAKIAKYS